MGDVPMRLVIEGYTREAGVRQLERVLARVVRKAAVQMLDTSSEEVHMTPSLVKEYLGAQRFWRDLPEKEPRIGVVNGLAYTAVGGELLAVECTIMQGAGGIQLTGQLGEVMKESGRAALSWVRAHTQQLGLAQDFYKMNDIHIHVPEGAVPKDGPSAGVTMATALVSALTGIPVRQDLAMTGEITLRGRVLPIGGLKEKTLAAYRAGIRTLIIPKENEKDLEEIPAHVLKLFKVVKVTQLDEVFSVALTQKPVPYQPAPETVKPELATEMNITGSTGQTIRPDIRAGV
jgi:ATP-dependent Lon protease